MPSRLAASLFAWGALAAAAHAQAPRVLVVASNLDGGLVWVDDALAGRVGAPVALGAGARRVRLVPADGSWSVAPVEADVPEGPADTVRLRLDVPYHYRVESQPFGAAVVLETPSGTREPLGRTPLLVVRAAPLDGRLVVEADGFAPARVAPGAEAWNRHAVALAPLSARAEAPRGEVVRFRPRRAWVDVAALGVAVAATAVSIHYKFQADRLYDEYAGTRTQTGTGDPALRPRINALDDRADAALAVGTAGYALFAVRLIFRR